jgi:hypothetical protein
VRLAESVPNIVSETAVATLLDQLEESWFGARHPAFRVLASVASPEAASEDWAKRFRMAVIGACHAETPLAPELRALVRTQLPWLLEVEQAGSQDMERDC